ncbi:MAG: hypothetical protein ACYDAQ_11025, partial [Mycobacteriales bacterium]
CAEVGRTPGRGGGGSTGPSLAAALRALERSAPAGIEVAVSVVGTPRRLPAGPHALLVGVAEDGVRLAQRSRASAATLRLAFRADTVELVLACDGRLTIADAGAVPPHPFLRALQRRFVETGGSLNLRTLATGFQLRACLPAPPPGRQGDRVPALPGEGGEPAHNGVPHQRT